MSTRWYPLYQGCPQLRIFLPNFWLKLIKPKTATPKNTVVFHCSMEMTKFDIKNYLTKIYNLPVIYIRTRIEEGRYIVVQGRRIKEDDKKIAYAVLDKSIEFEFPDVIGVWKLEQKKKEKDIDAIRDMRMSETTEEATAQNWFNSKQYP